MRSPSSCARSKGWKIRCWSSLGIPHPVSLTVSTPLPDCALRFTVTDPPAGVYLIALETRLTEMLSNASAELSRVKSSSRPRTTATPCSAATGSSESSSARMTGSAATGPESSSFLPPVPVSPRM